LLICTTECTGDRTGRNRQAAATFRNPTAGNGRWGLRRPATAAGDCVGRQRPLGIASLEDKIVQRALVAVLNAIYEADFLGFSYGFRPGRGQHDALDALTVGIESQAVNWMLDADIKGFFDNISHEWMMRFVEHRVGDRRAQRLIRKWLTVGVVEDGVRHPAEKGTPQGAVISPLLANI
jgi:RNA-directed DNA polymerase